MSNSKCIGIPGASLCKVMNDMAWAQNGSSWNDLVRGYRPTKIIAVNGRRRAEPTSTNGDKVVKVVRVVRPKPKVLRRDRSLTSYSKIIDGGKKRIVKAQLDPGRGVVTVITRWKKTIKPNKSKAGNAGKPIIITKRERIVAPSHPTQIALVDRTDRAQSMVQEAFKRVKRRTNLQDPKTTTDIETAVTSSADKRGDAPSLLKPSKKRSLKVGPVGERGRNGTPMSVGRKVASLDGRKKEVKVEILKRKPRRTESRRRKRPVGIVEQETRPVAIRRAAYMDQISGEIYVNLNYPNASGGRVGDLVRAGLIECVDSNNPKEVHEVVKDKLTLYRHNDLYRDRRGRVKPVPLGDVIQYKTPYRYWDTVERKLGTASIWGDPFSKKVSREKYEKVQAMLQPIDEVLEDLGLSRRKLAMVSDTTL